MGDVSLFGIRHHGPGSARSLERALEALAPDVVLIEGPPDANELLPLASHAGLEPPVALLIYSPESARDAVLYPFARFSPEWRAKYDRIAKRRGSKIAKVAVARQILTLCYYGLRDGEIRCLKDKPIDEHDNPELAEAA